jgi:hypothetical protein
MVSLYVVQITACFALVTALCVFNILFPSLELLQPRFHIGGFAEPGYSMMTTVIS